MWGSSREWEHSGSGSVLRSFHFWYSEKSKHFYLALLDFSSNPYHFSLTRLFAVLMSKSGLMKVKSVKKGSRGVWVDFCQLTCSFSLPPASPTSFRKSREHVISILISVFLVGSNRGQSVGAGGNGWCGLALHHPQNLYKEKRKENETILHAIRRLLSRPRSKAKRF